MRPARVIPTSDCEHDTVLDGLNKTGCAIIKGFLAPEMVNAANDALQRAEHACHAIQQANGVMNSQHTVHHLLHQAGVFEAVLLEFQRYDDILVGFFGGPYILNSYGGNLLQKTSSYASTIHKDIRTFSGKLPLMLNTIIMLDDFTEENGATWILPGGHRFARKPTDNFFYAHARQAIAPAGSLLIFNSNMWHAAGINRTDKPRRSVTPMFSKPFIKPQFDYCRALGDRVNSLPSYIQQLAGLNSRIPATLDEWYQPPEKRFYRQDQG